jgi:hypothetical protein
MALVLHPTSTTLGCCSAASMVPCATQTTQRTEEVNHFTARSNRLCGCWTSSYIYHFSYDGRRTGWPEVEMESSYRAGTCNSICCFRCIFYCYGSVLGPGTGVSAASTKAERRSLLLSHARVANSRTTWRKWLTYRDSDYRLKTDEIIDDVLCSCLLPAVGGNAIGSLLSGVVIKR